MSWIKEFKDFALRGNMVDLAIGIIIGAAFGKVVNSLVSDIIMPPIGLLIGGIDFSSLSVKMTLPGFHQPPVEIKYGLFINSIINLLILSGAIFLVMKAMNSLRKSEGQPPPPKEKVCPECKMGIPLDAQKCCHCCSPLPH